MDHYGDSRKLSLPTGSASGLAKKSLGFLRETYNLAQNTFNAPNNQYGYGQQQGLSQHFNNNQYGPPPQQHLYPQPTIPQHQLQQQWPRPPPSPNRPSPSQSPSPGPYMHGHPQGPQRPISPNYVPGQGMVSSASHGSHAPMLPQRHHSVATMPNQPRLEDLPPPPPYPGHSAPTPPPQQSTQQVTQHAHISPVSTGSSVQQQHSRPQQGWSPPTSQHQTPVQAQAQQQPAWNQMQSPGFQQQNPPLPSPPVILQQQQQPPPPQPPQQQYQAYSPPLQQSNHPPPPQRHPTAPNVHQRPQQYQPHHSNSYPSAALPAILRPSSSHGRTPSQEPAPPLPVRPSPHSTSPPFQPYQQQQPPPTTYSELPSPPQHQPQGQYFAPPPGVAEMYVPPPPSQQGTQHFSELAGNEPSGIQQGRNNSQQSPTQSSDVKTPIHQSHGLGIPQIAELPA